MIIKAKRKNKDIILHIDKLKYPDVPMITDINIVLDLYAAKALAYNILAHACHIEYELVESKKQRMSYML